MLSHVHVKLLSLIIASRSAAAVEVSEACIKGAAAWKRCKTVNRPLFLAPLSQNRCLYERRVHFGEGGEKVTPGS